MIRKARLLRVQRGLTLAQVAQAIGVDQAALSRFERCFHDLRPDNLIRYAQLLGTTVEEIHQAVPEEEGGPRRRPRLSLRRRASIAGAASWQRSRERKLRDSARGGEAVRERHGKAFFKALAHRRWARREAT